MALPKALQPLRHSGYRWLASALALSLLGTGLWIVAVVWQVIALDGGPGELSVVSTAGAVGMLATTLLGGVLADRVPQRRILLGIQIGQAALIGVVAALSLAGLLEIWQLALVSLAGGVAMGLYYPAYSALLPSLLPEEELLAANGLEGVLRPMVMQAGGPALASAIIAASSPGAALAVTSVAALGAAGCLLLVPATPVRRDLSESAAGSGTRAVLRDVREGFVYMARTPWLLATLLFASGMILLIMGPFEVLAPFAIKDRAGGGPAQHALVLAAFGIGGAAGSIVVASRRLPRRYLTVMNLMWGLGCIPLVVFGLTTQLWPMVVASAVTGAAFQAGVVIWGTLLQRRVPSALLGRVSSLDFFVSLVFMPVSMALAGPVSERIGLTATFVIAGLGPAVLAVVAILWARLPADELAHPLDVTPAAEQEAAAEEDRPATAR